MNEQNSCQDKFELATRCVVRGAVDGDCDWDDGAAASHCAGRRHDPADDHESLRLGHGQLARRYRDHQCGGEKFPLKTLGAVSE